MEVGEGGRDTEVGACHALELPKLSHVAGPPGPSVKRGEQPRRTIPGMCMVSHKTLDGTQRTMLITQLIV